MPAGCVPVPSTLRSLIGSCELCELQATHLVRDFHEVAPDPCLPTYREFRPGAMHRFCDKHRRASRLIMLPV